MGYSRWHHVDFRVIRKETDASFQVITANNKIYWLPKSQIADVEDYKAGDRDGTLSVTEWIAKQKGML